jgi:hypothetical protein
MRLSVMYSSFIPPEKNLRDRYVALLDHTSLCVEILKIGLK